jgi:type IV pilus assembly protein PilF
LLLCGSGREKQGLAYFDVALGNRAYRTPSVAASNAGACSLKLNDVTAAKAYFLQSLQYDPAGPLANVYMARWSLENQDVERARFHIGFVEKNNALSAEVLWLAIKTERQLGNIAAENNLVTQLRLRYPTSSEYAAYQRGAFDE